MPMREAPSDCKIVMAAAFSCSWRRSASLRSQSQGRCKTKMGLVHDVKYKQASNPMPSAADHPNFHS